MTHSEDVPIWRQGLSSDQYNGGRQTLMRKWWNSGPSNGSQSGIGRNVWTNLFPHEQDCATGMELDLEKIVNFLFFFYFLSFYVTNLWLLFCFFVCACIESFDLLTKMWKCSYKNLIKYKFYAYSKQFCWQVRKKTHTAVKKGKWFLTESA